MKKIYSLLTLFIMLSSCSDIKKDGMNIKTMYFSNVPSQAIKVGEFNNAGILLNVTYSNNSTSSYPVSEDWLPEDEQHYLGEAGSYSVKIIFRNKEIYLDFTMEANPLAPKYNVAFYDYKGNELESYTISHRLDAVYHGEIANREGYTFVGWDKSLYGVHQDMIYHPIYEIDANASEENGKQIVTNIIEPINRLK